MMFRVYGKEESLLFCSDVAFFDAPDWLMDNEKGTYTTPKNKQRMEEMGSTVVSFATAPDTVILK